MCVWMCSTGHFTVSNRDSDPWVIPVEPKSDSFSGFNTRQNRFSFPSVYFHLNTEQFSRPLTQIVSNAVFRIYSSLWVSALGGLLSVGLRGEGVQIVSECPEIWCLYHKEVEDFSFTSPLYSILPLLLWKKVFILICTPARSEPREKRRVSEERFWKAGWSWSNWRRRSGAVLQVIRSDYSNRVISPDPPGPLTNLRRAGNRLALIKAQIRWIALFWHEARSSIAHTHVPAETTSRTSQKAQDGGCARPLKAVSL